MQKKPILVQKAGDDEHEDLRRQFLPWASGPHLTALDFIKPVASHLGRTDSAAPIHSSSMTSEATHCSSCTFCCSFSLSNIQLCRDPLLFPFAEFSRGSLIAGWRGISCWRYAQEAPGYLELASTGLLSRRPSGHPLWDLCGKGWSGWTLGAHLMAVCETFTQLGNLSNNPAVNLKTKKNF